MGMKTPCLGAHSGSLKKTLVTQTHNLGAPGARTPVRQQPCLMMLWIGKSLDLTLSLPRGLTLTSTENRLVSDRAKSLKSLLGVKGLRETVF